MSMVLGSKTLFFYNPANPTAPIELAFQSRYGSIIAYQWFGEGFIMIGFSSGYLVVISTSKVEAGSATSFFIHVCVNHLC